jgi:hypothetical protein
VTGLIFECRNQRAVKAVDAYTFAKQTRKMIPTLSGTGQERIFDGDIHAARDYNNVTIQKKRHGIMTSSVLSP